MPEELLTDVEKAELDAALEKSAFRISKARVKLVRTKEFVFWAVAALHLQTRPVIGLGTMRTDGTYIDYDPFLLAGSYWSDDELVGVVAHETGHCVLTHHARRGNRDLIKWNIACDMALNPILHQAGLKLPKDVLLNPKETRSAEEIYLSLPDFPLSEGATDGMGKNYGGCGEFGDASAEVSNRCEAMDEAARQWDLIARQATYMAKQQGHLLGHFEHLLEPVKPKLDPRALLRQFVQMAKRDEYSWQRPNRRQIGRGVFYPSLRSESVGDIVVAADSSGSVSNDDYARALGMLNAILIEVRPPSTWFLQCDAGIADEQHFRAGQRLPSSVTVKGRGGTDMRPIWQWINAKRLKPCCAIVISDMEMDTASFGPAGGPGFPVLWLSSTKGAKAPFGTIVDFVE